MEFFLRSFDLLTEGRDDVVDALIVMTLVCDQTKRPSPRPGSIRTLARKLDMPVATVRRHILGLVQRGECVQEKSAVMVPAATLRGARISTFLRKTYGNAARLLGDLARIGVPTSLAAACRAACPKQLSRQQRVIAIAAGELLLSGMIAMRSFWGGDLMKGLVFTAIWTANVKHVTNTAPASSRTVLAAGVRRPVSVLAISRSLRLPYETVRRHANALLRDGVCVRAGRSGLLVPTSVHQRITLGTVITYRLVMDFLGEVRRAGVAV